MSARAAHRTKQPQAAGKGHQHSKQASREQLHRENERLHRENEELRRKVAEREKQIAEREKQVADAEKQIADAEKQIADLERQLALRQRNSTNSSKPPSSDGLAGKQRVRGRKHKSQRKPGGLVVLDSPYRLVLTPILNYVLQVEKEPADCRPVARDGRAPLVSLFPAQPARGDPEDLASH